MFWYRFIRTVQTGISLHADRPINPRSVAIHKCSLPKFQVQEAPDAVAMIAVLGTVFGDQAFDDLRLKEPPSNASWLQEHLFDLIQLRA